jgi:hypothetical protein
MSSKDEECTVVAHGVSTSQKRKQKQKTKGHS